MVILFARMLMEWGAASDFRRQRHVRTFIDTVSVSCRLLVRSLGGGRVLLRSLRSGVFSARVAVGLLFEQAKCGRTLIFPVFLVGSLVLTGFSQVQKKGKTSVETCFVNSCRRPTRKDCQMSTLYDHFRRVEDPFRGMLLERTAPHRKRQGFHRRRSLATLLETESDDATRPLAATQRDSSGSDRPQRGWNVRWPHIRQQNLFT